MCAGILGLLLSLAGLVSVWVVKPAVVGFANSTIVTLNSSVSTSQKAMQVTGDALGATVESVDALSTMLAATSTSVKDTQPMLDQVNAILGEKLPATMNSATDSLKTAQEGALVLDSTIKSLDSFRTVMSGTPFLSAFVEAPAQPYNPEKPLAESLGELATTLEGLPEMFTDMSESLDTADDNLVTIQTSLTTMSSSVSMISASLVEYQTMSSQSQSSMDDLVAMLTNIKNNLDAILNGVGMVLTLFFFWLLAAQVVILTQGWELFQGTAGRVEGGETESVPAAPATVD